ncbi:cation diffusion facilitator family transporter [Geosporobacter subterraneus DSM 17957]|uniref:Cation diffusion facilitator family transporter n=1 Tax=Geosporobacter subterraneus DSM 17957 TaxID=1121919 RepID=A0A1M6K0V8_9FIRM|nr:cation diffusion facilitator family transporter [Geosporobacter subterraneus]SHJ52472.1 cation diffusion facilitator family transporter [Geosporobacter subterraneus DSM 17957]
MDDNQRFQIGRRTSLMNIIGNVLLTALKATVGYIAGSTAMVADAFHSGSDILATTIVLHGLKISHRPPDEEHHYGHGKAESIVSKLIAILLVVTALGIGLSAYNTLKDPALEPPNTIAVWTALISIIFKEWMYRYTVGIGKKIKSQALIADAWHHRTDAFSSIAALIGITGAIYGYPILDPIAGIVVSAMIIKAAISIYLEALHQLMDTAPPKEVMDEIRQISMSVEGVRSVHDVKARKYGVQILVDMKICVDPLITVEQGHHLAGQAKHSVLEKIPDVKDVLIHVNPCSEKDYEKCNSCKHYKNG